MIFAETILYDGFDFLGNLGQILIDFIVKISIELFSDSLQLFSVKLVVDAHAIIENCQ